MKVGVLGASGYAGVELLRLCAAHPDFDVAVATAGGGAGQRVAEHTRRLAAPTQISEFSPAASTGSMSRPGLLGAAHGQSQQFIADLDGRIGTFVDLAADFRLTTAGHTPPGTGMSTRSRRTWTGRLRAPELTRASSPVPPHRRGRVLPDGRHHRLGAARVCRAGRARPHRGRCGERHLRCRSRYE